MKFNMNNLEFAAPAEMGTFKIENIAVEYSVQELAQFAQNTKLIIDTIKGCVKELTPIVSMEIEKHQKIDHSHRMERIEAEAVHA